MMYSRCSVQTLHCPALADLPSFVPVPFVALDPPIGVLSVMLHVAPWKALVLFTTSWVEVDTARKCGGACGNSSPAGNVGRWCVIREEGGDAAGNIETRGEVG